MSFFEWILIGISIIELVIILSIWNEDSIDRLKLWDRQRRHSEKLQAADHTQAKERQRIETRTNLIAKLSDSLEDADRMADNPKLNDLIEKIMSGEKIHQNQVFEVEAAAAQAGISSSSVSSNVDEGAAVLKDLAQAVFENFFDETETPNLRMVATILEAHRFFIDAYNTGTLPGTKAFAISKFLSKIIYEIQEGKTHGPNVSSVLMDLAVHLKDETDELET